MGAACCTNRDGRGFASDQPTLPQECCAGRVGNPYHADVFVTYNHVNFVVDNPGRIEDFYDIDQRKLGEGSFGSVTKAAMKAHKHLGFRAVKSINKQHVTEPEKFKQEVALMKGMDHPHIIKLYEIFEDARNVYLVMELCEGGELFARICEVGHFTEMQAAVVMKQILGALNYMHESFVCHRDLKPENFLFTAKEPMERSTIKIIDFGLSRRYTASQAMRTKAGTPYYVAPQVLDQNYDEKCDMWSVGVIMFVLLGGYPPFEADTDAEVLAKVRIGKFEFNPRDWEGVSEDAKHLITSFLQMNPSDRPSAEEALNHSWVKSAAPRAKRGVLSKGLISNLLQFRSQHRLKKAALNVIACQMDDRRIRHLREVFCQLDADNDGMLTAKELRDGMARAGLKEVPPDLQAIMEDVDGDGSGVVDYTEFLAATIDHKAYVQEDVVWSAFRVFDRNGDGQITLAELREVLSDKDVEEVVGQETIAKLMEDVDLDGDGRISFEEFMAMMRSEHR